MRSIELSEKHKNKLLEMFTTLFPENYDDDEDYYIDDDNGMITYLLPTGKNEWDMLEIHWFEFCMIHLKNKINYPENKINNKKLIDCDDLLNAIHPIDYLYQEFLKIK